jgi:hypothetical protein
MSALEGPTKEPGARAPVALFVFSTGHLALRELRPVVTHFKQAGWRVAVRIGRSGARAQPAVDGLRADGIDAALIPSGVGYEADTPQSEPLLQAEQEPGSAAAPRAPAATAPRGAFRLAPRPKLLRRARAFWHHYRHAMRNRRWAERLMAQESPDAVFLNMFHSVGEIDNAVMRAARRDVRPLFCLTNAPYVGELILLVARLNHLRSGMAGREIRADYDAFNRLMARLRPGWTRRLADDTIAFYWDPMRILAADLSGLGLERMWLKPPLGFEKVFVFGEFSRDLLAESGYPPERIVVAGQPLLDEIMRRRDDPGRAGEIAAHIGVPPGSPFLLVNVEPAMEHNYASASEHWEHFHAVMRACTGHGMPVVLSLHPLCDVENYRFAEIQHGVRICTEFAIHELYPDCGISVSFPCSTNLLAPKFEKPLVTYDFCGMVGRDADSERLFRLPGMLVARSEAELRAHISGLVAHAASSPPAAPRRTEAACSIILDHVQAVVSSLSPRPDETGVTADSAWRSAVP